VFSSAIVRVTIFCRLHKYDVEKKTHTVLMDKVHFANGVALSTKEDFLIIAETVRGRVFRFELRRKSFKYLITKSTV
jgi:sugar lactone lactonase YvrE